MATLDYLKQATISSQRRHRARMSEHGRLVSHPSFTIILWAALDFVSALVAGFIAFWIRLGAAAQPASQTVLGHLETTVPPISVVYLLVFSVYLVLFARLYGLYRSPDVRSGLNEQRLTVQATLTSGLMLCGTLYVMKEYAVSRIVVALTIVITLAFLMVRRAIARKMMQRRFL
jgi:FlaA1/EpsC-like NDP-sugar epimerase